jgi:hypothetical protein
MRDSLNDHIEACEARAAECRAKLNLSGDPLLHAELLGMEQRWLNIARNYVFFGSLEEYLLELHDNQIPSGPR